MKKSIIIIYVMVLFELNVNGQSQGLDGLKANISNVIPPTPGAAAMEKFSNIPVNFSTGVCNITYPFWSWQRGRLSFSLSLAYHSGGNKVQDMSSKVGTGWALNYGGRISRTVRGVRDDNPTRGFMFTPPLPSLSTFLYDDQEYYPTKSTLTGRFFSYNSVITPSNTTGLNQTVLKSIADGWLDAEQDIFSYTYPGGSGRFVFDKAQNVVKLEHNNVRILPTFSNYLNNKPNGFLSSFTIIDENGLVYFFGLESFQSVDPVPSSFGGNPETSTSEWLLSKITDPLANESIVFNYVTDGNNGVVKYETGFSQSQRYSYERKDYDIEGCPYLYKAFHPDNDVMSYSVITGGEASPSQIIFPDGSSLLLDYSFPRLDLVNSNALTDITVKNYRNEIVKRFQLNYSYFRCNPSGISLLSQNDYSRRLRLDEIKELSTDGLMSKNTVFTYNPLQMNARDSKNLDYWGYNVNPIRYNGDYVPKIRLNDPVPIYGFEFLPGADRRPDEIYSKAGALERIDYPTGGYTEFIYENNTAFSPIKYYENQMNSNLIGWSLATFNTGVNIDMPNRTETNVSFYFKADESNVRPVQNPNQLNSCFEQSQDNTLVSFEIYSTDGSFSIVVSDIYGNFLSGKSERVILPLDKQYKVKFIYNPAIPCSFQYPFTISASATYYVVPQDKLAGGLRIKKVISNDGLGGILTKEYSYNNSDGHSSAYLDNIPNYGYYKTVSDVTEGKQPLGMGGWSPCVPQTLLQHHINRSSESTNTVNYSTGAPIVYARVTERSSDGSSIVREYDPAFYKSNKTSYPYTPGQEFQNLSCLLIKETSLNNLLNVKKEVKYQYNKIISDVNIDNNKSLKIGIVADASEYNNKHYVVDPYMPKVTLAELTQMETKSFENGGVLIQTEARDYNSWHAVFKITSVNSKGQVIETKHMYPYDLNYISVYNDMVNRNMINNVVSIDRKKNFNTTLVTQKANYSFFNGNFPFPLSVQKSVDQQPFETEVAFNAYDASGNITEYTSNDGIVTALIWGYNKQYVVAKVVGKSYSDATLALNMTIVNNPANDNELRNELNKLRSLSGGLVQSYTYIPLVGVSSETDANGRTLYYEYDSFNRLRRIKDKDGNVVKVFDYQYQVNQ